MQTALILASLIFSLPPGFTQAARGTSPYQVGIPPVHATQEYTTWENKSRQRITLRRWAPYPEQEPKPDTVVRQWPVRVMGRDANIAEVKGFFGEKGTVLLANLTFDAPPEHIQIYSSGMPIRQFREILQAIRRNTAQAVPSFGQGGRRR